MVLKGLGNRLGNRVFSRTQGCSRGTHGVLTGYSGDTYDDSLNTRGDTTVGATGVSLYSIHSRYFKDTAQVLYLLHSVYPTGAAGRYL